MPANGQIGDLEYGRVKLHCFVKRDDHVVLARAIARTDELPAVIVCVMRNVENRLATLDNQTRSEFSI